MSGLRPDEVLRLVLAAVVIVAAVVDLRTRRIPNLLTFPSLALALAGRYALGGGPGLLDALYGFGLGLGVFFIPFSLGKLGAGDVKLMAVAGAFLGLVDTVNALILVSLAGGVYALGVNAWAALAAGGAERRYFLANTFYFMNNFFAISAARRHDRVKMCYGAAIAAGVLIQMALVASGQGRLVEF